MALFPHKMTTNTSSCYIGRQWAVIVDNTEFGGMWLENDQKLSNCSVFVSGGKGDAGGVELLLTLVLSDVVSVLIKNWRQTLSLHTFLVLTEWSGGNGWNSFISFAHFQCSTNSIIWVCAAIFYYWFLSLCLSLFGI